MFQSEVGNITFIEISQDNVTDSNFSLTPVTFDWSTANISRQVVDNDTLQHIFSIGITVLMGTICSFIMACSILYAGYICFRSSRLAETVTSDCDEQITYSSSCRPENFSYIQNGISSVEEKIAHDGDDLIPMTPMSGNPSDMFPYSDSSRNIHSDTIITPSSNNSIITMTMRNNFLIVETEERVPVNCYTASVEDLYHITSLNGHPYTEIEDCSVHVDNTNTYHCCSAMDICNIDRQTYFEPTSSRQADEDDQHIELYHKNILSYPPRTFSSFDRESDAMVSEEKFEEVYAEVHVAESPIICETDSTNRLRSNTGFTLPDNDQFYGESSSSSTPIRRANTSYFLGISQCEYEDCTDVPLSIVRKKGGRVSSLKLANQDGNSTFIPAGIPSLVNSDCSVVSVHSDSDLSLALHSVLHSNNNNIISCSSPTFSEPSN